MHAILHLNVLKTTATAMHLIIVMILFSITMSTTVFLTHILKKKLTQKKIVDIPNERSMHKAPIPRGGGLALLVVFIAGLLFSMSFEGNPAFWLLCALLILGGISFYDDKKGARISVRLAAHFAAAFLGSLALGDHALLFGPALPWWLDRAIIIVGWVWFMNLYNFMDGIDGISATQSIACVLGAALIYNMTAPHDILFTMLSVTIIGACAGFLVFNWHPAKIFLGDVGSVPLGFLTGFLLLKLATNNLLVAALILPLYYLADSGITIAKRILRGERFWKPHRQHFYQRAAMAIGRHDIVVLWILVTNIALIGLASLTLIIPFPSLALSFMVVGGLLFTMHRSAMTQKADTDGLKSEDKNKNESEC